jgi:hypothetical protein
MAFLINAFLFFVWGHLMSTVCVAGQVTEYVVFDQRDRATSNIAYLSFLGDYGLTKVRYDSLDDASKQDLGDLLRYLGQKTIIIVNYEFQMPVSDKFSIEFLAQNHVTAAVLANNHAGDHGEPGLLKNAETLKDNGIAPVGLKQFPFWRGTEHGQTFVLVAQTEALDTPCAIVNRTSEADLTLASGGFAGNSNIVIAVIHDAVPSYYITDYEDRTARSWAARGAKLTVIMGSHKMKGARRYNDALAIFSPGNFLLNWRDGAEYISAAPIVGFEGGKIVYLAIIPFYDEVGKKFRLLDGREGEEVFYKYRERSEKGSEAAYRDESTRNDLFMAIRNVFIEGNWEKIRGKHVRMVLTFLYVNYTKPILLGSIVVGLAVVVWRRRVAGNRAMQKNGSSNLPRGTP